MKCFIRIRLLVLTAGLLVIFGFLDKYRMILHIHKKDDTNPDSFHSKRNKQITSVWSVKTAREGEQEVKILVEPDILFQTGKEVTKMNRTIASSTNLQRPNTTKVYERNTSDVIPVQHVMFLKVHKAASSTLQSILLRFGYFHNLTFLLPKPPGYFWRNVISLNESLTPDNYLPPPPNKSFNILCCHVLYDSRIFHRVLPHQTKYVGILRDPYEQFISTVLYLRPREVINAGGVDPVATYLDNPSLYDAKDPRMSFTNNRMAVEFGFPLELFHTRNISAIHFYIEQLDREFDLVLIVERFHESVILMKRMFRWRLGDIIYIATNTRQNKSSSQRFNWTPQMTEKFKKWNEIDLELYDFFKRKLDMQIKKEDDTFQNEVRFFKSVIQDIAMFCNSNGTNNPLVIPRSTWDEEIIVTKGDCWLMDAFEINFVDVLRRIQYPDLPLESGDAADILRPHFAKIHQRHQSR